MGRKRHFQMLADYNQWMNGRIYECAGSLPAGKLAEDRGAFFGSLLGTLNHLVVADTVWLQRFVEHPACADVLKPVREYETPRELDQILFSELAGLTERRNMLDELILQWVAALREEDLDTILSYSNMKGIPARRRLDSLMMHFFNHQTHHRGQATTLLFQMGCDPGVTDLLVRLAEE
ncbi:DinB family protein [Gilvimarinus sp. F26214L]|uniref:DinB family protein n=1 Tax=Gilvimarinus sp. DZF01 TaxID=3461371 RepID=UPI0040458784